MGVEDATGEGGVDGFAEHRSEPGHGDHVDAGFDQHVGQPSRVPRTVEGRTEAAEGRAVDENPLDAGSRGDLECAAPAVHRNQRDGEVGGKDRLEDGPAARRQHRELQTGVTGGIGAGRRRGGHVGRVPAAFVFAGPSDRSARLRRTRMPRHVRAT